MAERTFHVEIRTEHSLDVRDVRDTTAARALVRCLYDAAIPDETRALSVTVHDLATQENPTDG